MTKIKFIDARFADPYENEFALKRRFEWHLRKLRALQEGVCPKVTGAVQAIGDIANFIG
ncbi:hypothetical protein P775_28650 [Puniceibacterium antarcticum]|uniref:Uncharacterized protein n=1 Tax=Puniceibacterium antarcticum TaxID=1206336 RepID=A0A2G8QR28_9RHOB|nr:hypothetical protein [Puniceibacterium antarcticum]PIL11710.1 hypothetical protein P775_28650 [Puniceibacterium antarcticum]